VKHSLRVLTIFSTVVLLVAATTTLATASVKSQTGTTTGVTPTTIKIGYITSQTGPFASTFKGGDQGALARIKYQNAHGGVNGRQIVLVAKDDGTQGTKTAAQDLVENEKVFGVIPFTAFLNGAASTYLNAQGIPVAGLDFDGPEWGLAPNSNMFSAGPPLYTRFDPTTGQSVTTGGQLYTFDNQAKFLKSLGVTKLATLGFGISASSTSSIKAIEAAAKSVGIKPCYENLTIALNQTSFTTEALAIKQAGCDGIVSSMVDSADVGLGAALTQAGVTPKAKTYYYTGYDQTVLGDPNATAALDGAYFTGTPNFTQPNAGTKAMVATIKKYAPSVPKGIPTLGYWGSYQAADVMIRGLQLAGKNLTREGFITKMRAEANYMGDRGLFAPLGISFTGFPTSAMIPKKLCTDIVQLKSGKYVTVKKNYCGKQLAFTQ
jgi:branched-chain amino acid transport system substrate-binding protein